MRRGRLRFAEAGTPEDLQAHKRILDGSVAEVTVLPMRFGAVLSDEHAVVTELLQANHDEFVAALRLGEAIEVKREDDTRLFGERMDEQRPVRTATSLLSARCCRRSDPARASAQAQG